MLAAQSTAEYQDALKHVAVVEKADVEPAICNRCVRCNSESATQVLPVGYGDHEHATCPARHHAVCRHLESLVGKELLERRVDVDRVAFEERDAITCVEHRCIESKAAAIDEVSSVDRADVDLRCAPLGHEFCDLVGTLAFHSHGLGEVVAGTGGDDCERAIGTRANNRVRDLAARAITTNCNEHLRAGGNRPLCEDRFFPGSGCLLKLGDTLIRERCAYAWQ